MPQQQTQLATEEAARFDAATLKKVVQLAERLQAREDESVSQVDLEAIGAEVGLRPASIRAAVREIQAQNAPKPRGRRRNSTDKAIVAAVWSAGWITPFITFGAATALHWPSELAGLAFLAGIAAYVAGGIIVTGVMGAEEQDPNAPPNPETYFQRAALLNEFARLQSGGIQSTRRVAFLRVEASVPELSQYGIHTRGEQPSLRRVQEWVERIVREQGGKPHGTVSEGLLAIFDDDAAAVGVARMLQEGARSNTAQNAGDPPLILRCGLRSGEVTTSGDVWELAGHPLARSARELQQAAAPGDIVVGPELAAAALTELGPVSPLPKPIAEVRAFSWLEGRR